FDPSHLHWQGADPGEFLRRFPDHIYHVHVKAIMLTLNGRSGILGWYLPYGDPRRGWDFRQPGHGGVERPAVLPGVYAVLDERGLDRDWLRWPAGGGVEGHRHGSRLWCGGCVQVCQTAGLRAGSPQWAGFSGVVSD